MRSARPARCCWLRRTAARWPRSTRRRIRSGRRPSFSSTPSPTTRTRRARRSVPSWRSFGTSWGTQEYCDETPRGRSSVPRAGSASSGRCSRTGCESARARPWRTRSTARSTRRICARCCRPCGCPRSFSTGRATSRPTRWTWPRGSTGAQALRISGDELFYMQMSPGDSGGGRAVRRGRGVRRRFPTASSPPCSSPTSSGRRNGRQSSATAPGVTCSSGTTGSFAGSWPAFAERRRTRPATGSSRPSTGRRARSAVPRLSSRASASSGSRFGQECTRANASCTRARSPGSPW